MAHLVFFSLPQKKLCISFSKSHEGLHPLCHTLLGFTSFFCPRITNGKRFAVQGTPVQAANVPKNAWKASGGTRWICFQKLGDFTPKMDGVTMQKPLLKWDDLGVPLFLECTQMLFYEGKGPSQETGKASVCVCVWGLLQADQKHFSKQNTPTKKHVSWLVVSTRLKNISQIGSFPQGSGWK